MKTKEVVGALKKNALPVLRRESSLLSWKAKSILASPKDFFGKLKETGINSSLYYLLILGILTSILSIIFTYDSTVSFLSNLLGPIISVYVSVMLLSSLLYVWILLFEKKSTYMGKVQMFEKFFQLIVYASTPLFLLSWMPWLQVLGQSIFLWTGQIYTLALLVLGTPLVYKMDQKKVYWIYGSLIALIIALGFI